MSDSTTLEKPVIRKPNSCNTTIYELQSYNGGLKRHLGLWGCVSIIVGIVIGVSIFEIPPIVFNNVSTPWHGLGIWLLGGVLSIVGALCYAELATSYPHMGGDYTYLTKAFHPCVGYLFGWGRLVVIQTGSIGALSYVFARYATQLFATVDQVWFAAAVVVALTVVNIIGVKFGKTTQYLLTISIMLGLAAVIMAGFFVSSENAFLVENARSGPGVGLAMIMVLYAFGGWNEAAFVAAEVREPGKNIPRALLISISVITLVSIIVNVGYLYGLGFEGLRNSAAPASEVLQLSFGSAGAKIMSMIVILSVLCSINGSILTGSRVYAAMGLDHKTFSVLGRWSSRFGTPAISFLVQCLITLLMIFGVGTKAGRSALDRFLVVIGLDKLPWEQYGGGFGTLVAGTAPVFWLFLLLSGISLFILRIKNRSFKRSFSVPLYPYLPLIFCFTCFYMLYNSIIYAKGLSVFGMTLLMAGIPFYWLGFTREKKLLQKTKQREM
ncbi:amino acid permease [Chitinispirillales bacterium ANBcel5]|uniref:APC family permease n=1 Tax=Cellulosispirillum alkaliphilum TaxID=3039283 RepID=UPI002A538221|nr:amino acid permease [Chitinispirillales bacterium ANBcel5]